MQLQQKFQTSPLRSLTRKIINEIKPDFKVVPLNSLRNEDYLLTKSLMLLLEKDGKNHIVSLDDIEAFAVGDTEYEAIDNLCDEIIELYEDLSSSSNLGPLPQKWLNFLNECIEKK